MINLIKRLQQSYISNSDITYAVVSKAYSYYDSFVIDDFTLEDDGSVSISSGNRNYFIKKPELFIYEEASDSYEYIEGDFRTYIEFI